MASRVTLQGGASRVILKGDPSKALKVPLKGGGRGEGGGACPSLEQRHGHWQTRHVHPLPLPEPDPGLRAVAEHSTRPCLVIDITLLQVYNSHDACSLRSCRQSEEATLESGLEHLNPELHHFSSTSIPICKHKYNHKFKCKHMLRYNSVIRVVPKHCPKCFVVDKLDLPQCLIKEIYPVLQRREELIQTPRWSVEGCSY